MKTSAALGRRSKTITGNRPSVPSSATCKRQWRMGAVSPEAAHQGD